MYVCIFIFEIRKRVQHFNGERSKQFGNQLKNMIK